jgi:hypothetical protein
MITRVYTVIFENVAVGTAAQDLFEITPADDKPVALLGLTLDNVGGTADAADAQEELIRLSIIRGFTTSGSGGSAPTPSALSPNEAAAGFTAEVNNTTVANTGTGLVLAAFGWNVRVPLREFWPEELCPRANQGNTTIVVRSSSTLADAITMSGTLYVAELG